MPSTIQSLPSDVIHLIAAGEVIDSLAAVVRELAENAIDAGATRIAVELVPDVWRVRVTDNGSGMGQADLLAAALPHSTSKIRNRQDLAQVRSLGFRGEALHSLAQLAELEICSRRQAEMAGWRVRYDSQGCAHRWETAAIAPGTIVTVGNLFGNWLSRRQALPSLPQQLRAVQLSVYHLALCHPHITWQVGQGSRSWFALYPGPSAREILPQILRDVQPYDLQFATVPLPDLPANLSLLLGLPDRCHRHRPDWVKVAINGRIVHVPELEQLIIGTLRRTLPRDRYPVGFLQLQVPAHQVDWNRHPAKAEIYLQDMDTWRQRVREAIAQALRLNPASLSEAAHSQRITQLLKTAEESGTYPDRAILLDSDAPEDGSQNAEESVPLLNLRALAQVHRTYILAEHPSGMWLVEQHIAHERVLYEQLCDRWQVVSVESPMILPQLTPVQVEQLQRLGLDVESFGKDLWAVRTVPEAIAQRQDCRDALLELSLGGDMDAALVAIACRTAIRNGMTLSLPQMQALLDQWQRSRHPQTCPHGRPIYLALEESSLSRFFRRHWVIGKSHGLA